MDDWTNRFAIFFLKTRIPRRSSYEAVATMPFFARIGDDYKFSYKDSVLFYGDGSCMTGIAKRKSWCPSTVDISNSFPVLKSML